MLTQIDLCSGIGAGFPLAGLALGKFQLIALAETNDFANEILSKRFPGVPNLGDIKSISTDIRRPDIITASPPCQPFSNQGKRQGASDSRDCIPSVARAIAELQPKYFAIENVPGLLNCPLVPKSSDRYFNHLVRFFTAIGYSTEWTVISSGMFGSPWLRERLLLVGFADSIKPQWEGKATWSEQIRIMLEKIKHNSKERSIKTGVVRNSFQPANGMERPRGIKSGDRTIRKRRSAIGNCLDPLVASVALRRILYINSIAEYQITTRS